jgi:hypothetical protein
MSRILQHTLGAEEFMDVIEIALVNDLDEALSAVYEVQAPRDMARALRRGIEYVPITWDVVPPDHFHVGNFPRLTLEQVPPEFYPYIVLAIEDMVPDAESATQDHVSVFRQALAVHSLASATPDEGSEIVYRRAIRMAVAVYNVLTSNPSTAALLRGLTNPTRGQSSIPWTYRAEGKTDKKMWFQSIGLSFALKTYTTQYD